ncbi:hypothetical protein [Pedobacter sp. N23S346]|uniref:hypothetical protein n=1 Tax=Pedobacter sp. N23S346 TaxID=3402750 RepID=UPI003AD7C228
MGVITSCYKCESCGDPFRLRYNLGNKYPQTAIFICSDCGDTLKFGFDANQESVSSKLVGIDFDRDLRVVNLHPELMIDQSGQGDALYFPSLDFLRKQSQRGVLGLDIFGSAQASCIDYQNAWDAIQTDFRYLKEGR